MTGSVGGSIYGNTMSQMVKDVQASEIEENAMTADVAADNLQVAQRQEESDTNGKLFQAFLKRNDKIKPNSTTVKKAKEKAEAKTKILPKDQIKDLLNKNPQFRNMKGLQDLVDSLKDGMSKEDLVKLIHDKYPNPLDAQAAFDFLSAISLDDFKQIVDEAKTDSILDADKKRREEYSKKVIADNQTAPAAITEEMKQLASITTMEDAEKFAERIILNPVDSHALYNLLENEIERAQKESPRKDLLEKDNSLLLKKMKMLLHVLGVEVGKLKDLSDNDNSVKMKSILPTIKRVGSILSMEIGIDARVKQLNSRNASAA